MKGESHLEWLHTRRSVRAFSDRPIDRSVLTRLLDAATTAPSSTNRQPWRFAVVTGKEIRRRIVDFVRERTEEMKAIIRRSHHGDEFGSYGDFFFEPLESATAIIVPQYREYPDAIAHLIESGGGDPRAFHTAGSMQAELCSTSAAIMALLLQAHAEGLGACWMAGPMVARDDIHLLLEICEPWRMVGAVALGHPVGSPGSPPPPPTRKPIAKIANWFDDETEPKG
jgi:nitroreductase